MKNLLSKTIPLSQTSERVGVRRAGKIRSGDPLWADESSLSSQLTEPALPAPTRVNSFPQYRELPFSKVLSTIWGSQASNLHYLLGIGVWTPGTTTSLKPP